MKASFIFLVVLWVCTFMWKHGSEAYEKGRPGILAVVAAGDVDGVVRCLEAGAPLVDETGTPVLVWAAWQGQTGVLEALIEQGADVNARTGAGWTALMMAVVAERSEVVEALLRAGADVEVRTKAGATALSMALDRGDERTIEILVRARARRGEVVAAGR